MGRAKQFFSENNTVDIGRISFVFRIVWGIKKASNIEFLRKKK